MRTFTVRQKILSIALITSLAMIALYSVQYYVSARMKAYINKISTVQDQMEIVSDASLAATRLVLIAMDVIVDKDEGRVSQERIDEIQEEASFLQENIDTLQAATLQTSLHAQAKNLPAMIQRVITAIQQDLTQAVSARASEETFGKLDDLIDGQGTILRGFLTQLYHENGVFVKKQFVESKHDLNMGANIAQGTFVVVSLCLLGLVATIGRSITKKQNVLITTFEDNSTNVFDSFSKASTSLEKTAHTMAKTAETNLTQSKELTFRTGEMSVTIQNVAVASAQLLNAIEEIKKKIAESSKVSSEACTQAKDATHTIENLSNSTHQINAVVELISSIAEKTNLLALNATIEAMRAGDAGKGFSVVASEVKSLATQTSKAASDIITKVTDMQHVAKNAVQVIGDIASTIDAINNIAATISAAVEQQRIASSDISNNTQEVAKSTDAIVVAIKEVHSTITDTDTASRHVLNSVQTLDSEVGNMRSSITTFVKGIQAA
jgi:methyl-accepting chemotaxis protein